MKRWWYSRYEGDPNQDNFGLVITLALFVVAGLGFLMMMLATLGVPLFVAFVIGLLVYLWYVFKP
jgi:hypothetical protein